jgi:hypothetical protein
MNLLYPGVAAGGRREFFYLHPGGIFISEELKKGFRNGILYGLRHDWRNKII